MKQPRLLLLVSALLLSWTSGLQAQCGDTLVSNGGFEAGLTDWWTWHGGAPDAYAFLLSDDSFMGDSSAVIDILVDSDSISGGSAEYNNRPQTIPVVGGEFYEISFAAKSTVAGASVNVNVKDENDNWVTLHSESLAIGTSWGMVSTTFQADVNRADIHMEFTVFNGDIHVPYQVFFDEICMTSIVVTTNTCADNLVANPGFESGSSSDWWNWHSNNPTAFSFETSDDAYVGDSSALMRVLLPSDSISGPGEFNSRPQTSAIADSQNYRVTFFAKSTVENTEVSVWVKDEFDGWTTIHTETFTIGTAWIEATTVFTADQDRADVHVELKAFNAGFQPYDVWIDEVSICTTTDDPGTGGDDGPILTFGSTDFTTTCANNMAPGNDGFEPPNDTMNWDIWDGSDTEELSSFHVDPVLPNSGINSVRMDITEGHDVAEFHHRFGPRFTIEDGKEYSITVWMRSDVPAGDSVQVLTRVVRDTDWESQTTANLVVTENNWLNFSHTFTGSGTWNNAFLEFKAFRWTDFGDAYSVWFDDVAICSKDSASTTGLEDLTDLGLTVKVYPNPVGAGSSAFVEISSPQFMSQANLSILDMMGRTIQQSKVDIHAGTHRQDLSISGLAAGLYLVQVEHDGFAKSLKLHIL